MIKDDGHMASFLAGEKPLSFASEKAEQKDAGERWKLLVVDDEREVHALTRLVLGDYVFEGRRLEFLHAYSGAEARPILDQHGDIAVILLDVVMETQNAGLELAKWIREDLNNPFVRIILRTGQPGEAPEKQVIEEYEINDYKYKTELTDDRLFASITTAIRSYRHLAEIEQNRQDLREAKDKAEAASLAKDQFLANMSHELRTPLNGILGLVNLLNEAVPDGQEQEYCRMIKNSGEGLLAILNNALELSSLREGTFSIEEKPFMFRGEVSRIVDVMQIQAGWKNLRLHWSVEPTVPDRLVGDSGRLRQVLVNLFVNAIRHTESGGVSLNVSRLDEALADALGGKVPLARTPDEVALFFVVSDTGGGISSDRIGMIFEPFELGEDYMTKRLSGAGLGLAITHDIITRMNGGIWVESEEQEGSQFYFSLCFKMSD